MAPVGVLALQGDFAAHLRTLERLGVAATPVRTRAELETIAAVVLPGGESTAMLRLMEPQGLFAALAERVGGGLPVLATCAGVILLAVGVEPDQPSLGCLDVDVARNAYGRQVHSSVEPLRFRDDLALAAAEPGVFIRAPRITRVGPGVRELAWRGGDPVLVESGAIIAATFHPELGNSGWLHRYFAQRSGMMPGAGSDQKS